MKTNALIARKTSLYFLIGFLSLIITSCGSYQNSSYYDSDGVYGTNGEKVVKKDNPSASASVQYKEYFNSLQNTSASGDIFTDVNSYSNDYTENDSIQAPSTGYASWGSSPQETTVTVYPDSYWSFGIGWGYPYYGYGYGYPYYGWGYPYYGWGYPGYGWGYPGYGYPGYGYPIATPYAYNYSRRGSSYGGRYNNSIYNNGRATAYNRNNVTGRNRTYNNTYNRNSTNYNRNSTNNVVNRKAPTFTNRNSYSTNSNSRNYNQSQTRSNSSYTPSRTNTQSTQRSSYTPSNNSYRSSGGGMGGGTRMSSGGGGRMSGGGGRR